MNTAIPVVQNTEKQIERLRAQRALYSRAKTLLGIHIAFGVPFAVPLVDSWHLFSTNQNLRRCMGNRAVALLDLAFFTPQQKRVMTKAAKIQEAFDCDVPWPEPAVRSMSATAEDSERNYGVVEPSARRSQGELKDWYPPAVGQLPLPLARAVCQRANCW